MCSRDDYPPHDPEPIWLPFFKQQEVTTFGSEWPTYLVERWERNSIGEERFTGEVRTYRAAPPTALAYDDGDPTPPGRPQEGFRSVERYRELVEERRTCDQLKVRGGRCGREAIGWGWINGEWRPLCAYHRPHFDDLPWRTRRLVRLGGER